MRQWIEAGAVRRETVNGHGGEKVASLLEKWRSGRKKTDGACKTGVLI